jgi:hypothetical protein
MTPPENANPVSAVIFCLCLPALKRWPGSGRSHDFQSSSAQLQMLHCALYGFSTWENISPKLQIREEKYGSQSGECCRKIGPFHGMQWDLLIYDMSQSQRQVKKN